MGVTHAITVPGTAATNFTHFRHLRMLLISFVQFSIFCRKGQIGKSAPPRARVCGVRIWRGWTRSGLGRGRLGGGGFYGFDGLVNISRAFGGFAQFARGVFGVPIQALGIVGAAGDKFLEGGGGLLGFTGLEEGGS